MFGPVGDAWEDAVVIFDPEMIQRIESSAARVTMATVEGFVANGVDDPARAEPFGDGALVAFGPGRYVNRAIGVSLVDPGDGGLDRLEAFYDAAGLPASLEVASWAPASLLARLAERGYTVGWYRNVYVADLREADAAPHPAMRVRPVTDDSIDEWLTVLREGNEVTRPDEAVRSDEMALAAATVPGETAYLAALDGRPAGCGSLTPDQGVAWLGGAATAPSARRRGVQGALVRHRTVEAKRLGCDLAVATAMPAGGSARNLARVGFTLAYCQTVMTRRRRQEG